MVAKYEIDRPIATDPRSMGRRLCILRTAHGLSRTEICKSIGIELTYWSRFENGHRAITFEFAYLLVDRFSVTLDWIFLGRTNGMTLEVVDRLKEAERKGLCG